MHLEGLGRIDPAVADLIAERKYGAAADLLSTQIARRPQDHRLRTLLADVLVTAGDIKEAMHVLGELSRLAAREGHLLRAIAAVKRMQRLEPGRAGLDEELARVVRGRARPVAGRAGASSGGWGSGGRGDELGIEIAPGANLGAGRSATPNEVTFVPPAAAAPAVTTTPLFDRLEDDELIAVAGAMGVRTHEPGDIVVAQGEPGESLLVLVYGLLKAYVRDPVGRYVRLVELGEGAVVGEISLLSRKPRTVTITAATASELLELDARSFEPIAGAHPNVREAIRQFNERSADNTLQAAIERSMSAG